MQIIVQHLYKLSPDGQGLLYAWFLSMHTRVDIVLCSRKLEKELVLVVNRIFDTLRQLEKVANFYDSTSELSFVNQTASVSPVVLSEELYAMIELCLEYNGKTFGCFDVAVHSKDYTRDTIHSVHLFANDNSIYFSQPGIVIDLSGFLKGYALEVIKGMLKEAMIEDALVNMGNSSILALGNHPAGLGWMVNNVLLQNECLTTSGNDRPGRKHIISPQSGNLVEDIGQIAIVTADGAIGEILSTSLFAADEKQRETLLIEFSSVLRRYLFIDC